MERKISSYCILEGSVYSLARRAKIILLLLFNYKSIMYSLYKGYIIFISHFMLSGMNIENKPEKNIRMLKYMIHV
jgi:uncharacterized membrane protein